MGRRQGTAGLSLCTFILTVGLFMRALSLFFAAVIFVCLLFVYCTMFSLSLLSSSARSLYMYCGSLGTNGSAAAAAPVSPSSPSAKGLTAPPSSSPSSANGSAARHRRSPRRPASPSAKGSVLPPSQRRPPQQIGRRQQRPHRVSSLFLSNRFPFLSLCAQFYSLSS